MYGILSLSKIKSKEIILYHTREAGTTNKQQRKITLP